jgi:hypothetical protein
VRRHARFFARGTISSLRALDARSCRGDAAGAEEEEASKNSDAEEGPDDGLLGEYRPGQKEGQTPASARILPEKAEVSA